MEKAGDLIVSFALPKFHLIQTKSPVNCSYFFYFLDKLGLTLIQIRKKSASIWTFSWKKFDELAAIQSLQHNVVVLG